MYTDITVLGTCKFVQKTILQWRIPNSLYKRLIATIGGLKQAAIYKPYSSNPEVQESRGNITPLNQYCSNSLGVVVCGTILVASYYLTVEPAATFLCKTFNLSRTLTNRISNLIEWQCDGAMAWFFIIAFESWAKEGNPNAQNASSSIASSSSDNTARPDQMDQTTLNRFINHVDNLCPVFFNNIAKTLIQACEIQQNDSDGSKTSSAGGALIVYTTAISITYLFWSLFLSKSCQLLNLSKKLSARIHTAFADHPLQACVMGVIWKTFDAMSKHQEARTNPCSSSCH